MNETKKQLKERVNFIVKKPKWSIIAAICMVLVCAIVAGCTAAGSRKDPDVIAAGRYTVTVQVEDLDTGLKNDVIMCLEYNDNGQLIECEYDGVRYVYAYDEEGKKISDTFYYLTGELFKEYQYSYNDAGQLILRELIMYDSDPNGELGEKTVYQYHPDGNLECAAFYSNGVDLSVELLFDRQDNLVEERNYLSSGTVSRNVYTYTEDGKLLTSYREQYGEPHIQETYSYDEAGLLIRKEYVHTCGNLPEEKTVTTYSYDRNGRCVRRDVADSRGGQSFAEYTYDATGNMLSYVKSENERSFVWTYDAQGRMLSCKHTAGSKSILCAWAYDAQGNVIGYTDGNVRYTFTYDYPGAEMHAQVREEFAKRLVMLTELTRWSSQTLAQIG